MFVSLLSLAAPLTAHRQHISWTHLEYNARSRVVEISHRLHEHDLQPWLREQHGGDLSDLEVRTRMAAYVIERFSIAADTQRSEGATLIGAELSGPYLHVYQEIAVKSSPANLTLTSTVLMDFFADQVNMINVVTSSGVITLELDKDSGEQAIRLTN